MSFQRVESLSRRFEAMGLSSAIEKSLNEIGFDDRYVAASISAATNSLPRTIVIKDTIWGMIELDQSSMRLVDSPILQRLRGIRQTGFTYLTYPPSEHTRFTHSLGMTHVVSKFLDAIRKQPTGGQPPTAPFHYWQIDEIWPRLLLHAALLHDCGHLPFSHVSEAIVEADDQYFMCGPASVNDILFEVEHLLEPDKEIHFAECLSLAILLTPRFKRFYTSAVCPGTSPEAVFKIAAMIAGIPPSDGMPGLAGIISGTSVDADKIDYINRDAAACGIPVGVDVSRLFVRSGFLTVKPEELQRLRSSPSPPAQPETIFIVNASGLDSIEEIGQARTALYHRVYLHQTTRNAERLLASGLYSAAQDWKDRTIFDPKNVLDIWGCADFRLLDQLQNGNVNFASQCAHRIRNRQLPKRACVFGRNFTRMSHPISGIFVTIDSKTRKTLAKQIVGTGLNALRRKSLFGKEQRKFEKEILDEIAIVAAAIRKDTMPCPTGLPDLVTVLPMPNLEANRSDCIVLENHRLSSTAANSISDEQMEAADIAKSVGYVMADVDWREIAFIAARTVLYRRRSALAKVSLIPYPGAAEVEVSCISRILLDAEAVIDKVGLVPERLRQLMSAADRSGYFKDKYRLAQSAIDPTSVHEAAAHLRYFKGQGNWSVTAESVQAFLEQFPTSHRATIVKLIREFKVLNPSELVSNLLNVMKKLPQLAKGKRGFIVGLSPDSGNAVRVKLEHDLREALEKDGWKFKKTIRDVLEEAETGDDVIFCDDNVTSGSQTLCQFMAWLGVPESDWTVDQLKEQGIERASLTKSYQNRLKSMRVSVISAVGTMAGQNNLKVALPKLGLTSFAGLFYESEVAEAKVNLKDTEEFLQDVGRHLIAWVQFGGQDYVDLSPDQKAVCDRDALGYSNAKALMCTPLNVPVGTVTAFWCPGMYRGEPWMPLLVRRGYLKHLILA